MRAFRSLLLTVIVVDHSSHNGSLRLHPLFFHITHQQQPATMAMDRSWRHHRRQQRSSPFHSDSNRSSVAYYYNGSNFHSGHGCQPNFDDYFQTTLEYSNLRDLETIIPPLLVIIGCAGNALVAAMLVRQPNSRGRNGGGGNLPSNASLSAITDYLTALALANVVSLVFGRGLDWVTFAAGVTSVMESADWICRLWRCLLDVVRYSAGRWLIVAMLAERYMASSSRWSVSSDAYCTIGHAKAIVLAIAIGLVVVNVHSLWIYELLPDGRCDVNPHRVDFEAVGWPSIAATVNQYIPLTAAFLLSILLASRRPRFQTADDIETGNRTTTRFRQRALETSMDECPMDESHLTLLALRLGILYSVIPVPTACLNLFEYAASGFIRSSCQLQLAITVAVYVGIMANDTVSALAWVVALVTVKQLRRATVDVISKSFVRGRIVNCFRCCLRCRSSTSATTMTERCTFQSSSAGGVTTSISDQHMPDTNTEALATRERDQRAAERASCKSQSHSMQQQQQQQPPPYIDVVNTIVVSESRL